MRGRAVIFCAGVLVLGAAIAVGCGKRTLDSRGPGTGALDAGGAGSGGGAGGGGASGSGASGSGAGAGVGGVGGIIPPGDLKKRGEACVSGAQCATGSCADGVCCDVDCAGACVRCDQPGLVGSCASIPNGATPKTPGACPVEIALTCGADGTCDGAGACRLRPTYTVCGAGSCDGDAVVGQMVCDGRGSCRAGPPIICVPYRCDPATAACQPGCATDADCVGTYCESTGRCHIRQGPSCQRAGDCASGFCVAGVCCNTACTDPCFACNLPGREGACSPRPDGCPGADAAAD